MPDSSKNLTFILKDSANNLIFDSRPSNSTLIHQFYDSASTQLRLQSFSIGLYDEFRVGNPLCRNLQQRETKLWIFKITQIMYKNVMQVF